MRKLLLFCGIAVAAIACAETATEPFADPGGAFLAEGRPAALHDLTTPALAGSVSGSTVTLEWTPTDLQADCDAAATANTQNSATTCWGVHWEVYRDGVKVAEPSAATFTDAGLPDGTYAYMVKGKGMEGTPGPSVYTHHSPESNTVTLAVSSGCPAPTTTLGASKLQIVTGGGNSETVILSGQTTNVVDCAGGELEYRLVDSRAGDSGAPGGDHSVDWTSLAVAADGSFSFTSTLRTAQVGRTYTFTTRVRNADNPTWVESTSVVITVVSGGGPTSSGRGM